jgi:hypothetical protein
MMMIFDRRRTIINEGRYDSLTRVISNDILFFIKKTKNNLNQTSSFQLPYDKDGEESYLHESGIEVDVEINVHRTNDDIILGEESLPFYIRSYVSSDDVLVMEIFIDNTFGDSIYERMYSKINEDVRHEIEHLTQILMKKQKPTIDKTADYENVFDHHMDPSEVEALVHGFYRVAKIEKRPLDSVMWDDINTEISRGELTNDEGQLLFKTWLDYAIKNLPKAQYTPETKRRIIFKK